MPVTGSPDLPMQPLCVDADGIVRFVQNRIVRHLLDAYPGGLNALELQGFAQAEHCQLAQLIGYSLQGFGELSYVDDATRESVEHLRSLSKTDSGG